jgi:Kef-type K+ transport system membrane component KefB
MNGTVEIFTAASHQDILALITQIAVLLFTAKLFSEIAQRLGQPSVIGELLAGIILGPSCLGKILPFIHGIVIPATPVQGYLLEAVALIGVMFLLLITGLETDLNLIRRHAKTALGVSFGGILVTFSSGFILGQFLPDFLLTAPDKRTIFSLFIATAMSISAIPVIAKVLMDLNLMRRDIGQIIIAAGMSDDTIGWILLSIVAGLAGGQIISTSTVIGSVGTVLIFIIGSFLIGRWLVKKVLVFVQDEMISHDRLLTLAVVLTFIWGSLTQALHLEPVLGAFVMGILLGQMPRFPQGAHEKLRSIAIGIFSPIFFAVAGLKVNVLNLLQPDLLVIALIVIMIAVVGKVTGTYLGARLIGKKEHWTALSFGAALNARGAMEIIVATIGLSLGILTQEMFSIIVLMAMVTSLMAPSALRYVLRHVKPGKEELDRLKKEELAKESPFGNIHRVLVPVRRRRLADKIDSAQMIKSRILQKISKKTSLSITLLTVDRKKHKTENLKFLKELGELFPDQELTTKAVESRDTLNTILDEAQKDYDLLLLGGSEHRQNEDHLFSRHIDSVVSLSPIITMVVQSREVPQDWSPKNILVPTNGSLASKNAAQLAFLMCSEGNETVGFLNVLEKDVRRSWRDEINDAAFKRQMETSLRIVEELRGLAETMGVKATVAAEVGTEPETVIAEIAKRDKFDLIILGTDVRPASERLFLGPRVEAILKTAPCPVVVLNST